MRLYLISVALWAMCLFSLTHGHGRLLVPLSRSTMWRYGYDVPPNWTDHELFCGGFSHQWDVNGGKCGICGDPWDGVRDNEAGGLYASGINSAHYSPGSVMEVTLQLTANHMGWSEWRICPNNDVNTPATQECLDQHLLEMVGGGTRWEMPKGTGKFTIPLQLPPGLTCEQCVVQWLWVCGNRWGCGLDCAEDECDLGCGPQEQFMGCADISIG